MSYVSAHKLYEKQFGELPFSIRQVNYIDNPEFEEILLEAIEDNQKLSDDILKRIVDYTKVPDDAKI
tara:strand:- start:65 stop:265 length:201 start_codon:yes stop_codon:yes gene_type:complete